MRFIFAPWLKRTLDRVVYVVTSPRACVRLLRARWYNSTYRIIDEIKLDARVKCELCGWQGRRFHFFLERQFVIADAECPACHSQVRNRKLLAQIERLATGSVPGRCLDIAPHPRYRQHLQQLGYHYTSMDLGARRADVWTDLIALGFRDSCFDLVLCSHVLEHIADYQRALAEILRVLTVHGVALIDVPRRDGCRTSGLDQPDHQGHYWLFGDDTQHLIEAVGFGVEQWCYDPGLPASSSNTFFVARRS